MVIGIVIIGAVIAVGVVVSESNSNSTDGE